jgi:hypothetical protein
MDTFETFKHYLPACTNEQELRDMFSRRVLPNVGLTEEQIEQIRHEYVVIKGRIDSLYGKAILEFKSPGKVPRQRTSPAFEEIVDQIDRQMKGISRRDKLDLASLVGICFDGKRVSYHYIVDKASAVQGPYDVDRPQFDILVWV